MSAAAVLIEVILALGGWAHWPGWSPTPTRNRPQAVLQFYGALFVALSGSVAALTWLARRALLPARSPRFPLTYLSHGMVLSAVVIFGLWLQSLRLLSPLHVVLLIGLFLFFELALAIGGRGA